MSKKCCRSTPRCAGCPVWAVAAARRRGESGDRTAVLVEEVLGGRPPRPLPNSVAAALEQLRTAAAAG